MVCYGELKRRPGQHLWQSRQWMSRNLSLRPDDSSGDGHCMRVVIVHGKAVLGALK